MRAVVVDTLDWGPDVLLKILPDLDGAFFNGLLRNKIQVSWQDVFSIRALESPSSEFDDLNGICYVYLNRHKICQEAPEA